MTQIRFAVVLSFVILISGVSSGAVWYVGGAGADDGNAGSQDAPFATIQRGVDAAAENDTILIADGTYLLDRAIDTKGLSIELKGASENRDAVIVDAQGQCPCLINTNAAQLIIGSITFQNGYSSGLGEMIAGGITSSDRSLITNCVVRNCRHFENGSNAYGGGLCLTNVKDRAERKSDKWPSARQFLPTLADVLITGCAVSARDTAKRTTGGGGAYAQYFNCQNVTVENCVVTNDTPVGGTEMAAYGGGLHLSGGSHDQCVVRNNRIVNQEGRSGYLCAGGGVYLSSPAGRVTELQNSLVTGNVVQGCGAGVGAYASVYLIACTITQNVIQDAPSTEQYQTGGAGIYMTGNDGLVENCLIAENSSTSDADKTGYAGAICVNDGKNLTIRDCVIRDNDMKNVGALSCISAGGLLVTNCVMVGNKASKEVSAIRFYTNQKSEDAAAESLITDCYIVSNSNIRTTSLSNGSGVLLYSGGQANNANVYIAPLTVRNCLFAGNRAANGSKGWGVRVTTGALAKSLGSENALLFDHCTFVTNFNESNYSEFVTFYSARAATNTTFKGCVLAGNCYTRNGSSRLASVAETYPYATFQNCYADVVNASFTMTEENGNLTGEGVNFVDPENFDFRLQPSSVLVDKGGAFEDWMGTGRRKSAQDMGGGYVIGSVGKYGVTVSRPNSNPRRYGVASDIGCCEFWVAPGLMLLFR